jgi:uncharacterized protein YnzC (UPF0291/DUF896 family)
VGTKYNAFSITVLDENGDDVSYFYEFKRIYGELKITPRALSLKADDASKVYDGTPLTCNAYTILEGSLLDDHKVSTYTVSGSQTDVGRSENLLISIKIEDGNGKDVTANYAIDPHPGILRVKGR